MTRSSLLVALTLACSGLLRSHAQGSKPVVYVSAQDSAEMWATGKKPRGRGTQAEPFYGDFDAILSKTLPNTIIQLTPAPGEFTGKFYTQGWQAGAGERLKEGQELAGTGMGNTTIVLKIQGAQKAMIVVVSGRDPGDGITVRDLSIDCSAEPGARYVSKRNGVNLTGSHCLISNVEVQNSYGTRAGEKECFAIGIFLPKGGYGGDNVIRGCRVNRAQGNYVSAIGLYGSSGNILGNQVVFPDRYAPTDTFFGINCAQANNVTIATNEVHNGIAGFYTDTGDSSDVTIRDNVFTGVRRGVYLNGTISNEPGAKDPPRAMDNFQILRNRIELDPAAPSDVVGVFLNNTSSPHHSAPCMRHRISGVVIRDNSFGFAKGSPPTVKERYAVVIAANHAYDAASRQGIADVLVSDNEIQEGSRLGHRNKVHYDDCNPRPAGAAVKAANAHRVRGWHQAPEGSVAPPIQWDP
ncbi:MAG: right-handed parallel beta-helix repeat-containing protein [Verrucomicrobia bacterium]|nr:right-handed parallel beta-helix repeat-containing protein [Verrucomicrobiota bacterium]